MAKYEKWMDSEIKDGYAMGLNGSEISRLLNIDKSTLSSWSRDSSKGVKVAIAAGKGEYALVNKLKKNRNKTKSKKEQRAKYTVKPMSLPYRDSEAGKKEIKEKEELKTFFKDRKSFIEDFNKDKRQGHYEISNQCLILEKLESISLRVNIAIVIFITIPIIVGMYLRLT